MSSFNQTRAYIQKTDWTSIRSQVAMVNPTLANIIDDISPGKNLSLWQVEYPYGALIDDGRFYYPTSTGDLVLLEDSRLSKEMKDDFAYAGLGTPAGIVLKNSIEIFIELDEHVILENLFLPGYIFALWGRLDQDPTFHPSPMMCATAGARSIFMVPNISDLVNHKHLKNDFNIKQPPPKKLQDQWLIFKNIVNHPSMNSNWKTEALLFSGIWLEKIKHDPAFQKLYLFLLESVWRATDYWRNQKFYDFAFSAIQQKRALKPNPYLLDTVKYLITTAIGVTPGFTAANDNIAAPIDLIQKAYIESYELKKYVPTILHPYQFSRSKERPVYYSTQHPTTPELSPRSRKLTNTINDLSEAKHLLDVIFDEINRGRIKIDHGIIATIAKEIDFAFYHTKPDRHGEIKLTKDLAALDPNLVYCCHKKGVKNFADSGTFMRGCVKISKK